MCEEFGHILIVTYSRPWRRFFRLTYHLRCVDCDTVITEP